MPDIAFGIDDNFVIPLGCVLNDLKKNVTNPSLINIYIIYSVKTLSLNNIKNISKWCETLEYTVKFINADDVLSKNLKISKDDHVSLASYYRLYLPSLLGAEVGKVLYLDVDITIIDNIDCLFDFEFSNCIAAVDHYSFKDQVRLWGPEGGTYFNAGILLFNLKAMRNDDFINKVEQALVNHKDRILWHDQDVLNLIYENAWSRLPLQYNITRDVVEYEIDAQISNPKIIHFDGWKKPWIDIVERKYSQHWRNSYYEFFGVKHSSDYLISKLKRYRSRILFNIKNSIKSFI